MVNLQNGKERTRFMKWQSRKVEIHVSGSVTREADADVTVEVCDDISNEELLEIYDQLEVLSANADWLETMDDVVPEMVKNVSDVDPKSAADFRVQRNKEGELVFTKIEPGIRSANGKGRRGSGAGIVLKVIR